VKDRTKRVAGLHFCCKPAISLARSAGLEPAAF
jgi:hypothetical protein